MAKALKKTTEVKVSLVLELDEQEMAALEALTSYGTNQFLKMFYAHLGRHYLTPYEAGLRSLFETIRKEVPPILSRAATARIALKNVGKDYGE